MLFYALTYYLLAVLGVNLGYHRMLAHRAVRLPRGLARLCVVLGLPAGPPVQWAATHRYHHAHADTKLDPHAPGQCGFWYAHCGWYYGLRWWPQAALYALAGPARLLLDAWLRPRLGAQRLALASDVAGDGFYHWLSQPGPYAAAMHLHCAVAAGVPYWLWGTSGLELVWVTLVVLYNLGDSVDSLAHNRQGPVDRPWLAWASAGEGWHVEHHHMPGAARLGRAPGHFDFTWQVIRLLARAGWAKVEHEDGIA